MPFDDEKPELNITPLVDIMLVLLAILMVTAPSITYEEKINLPQGSQKNTSAPTVKSLIISINAKKEIFLKRLSTLGKCRILEQKYNTFRASRNLKNRNIHLHEQLYILVKN